VISAEEKLEIALEALRAIARFDHAPNCTSSAPVHECGCYDADECEIAKDALRCIEGDGPRPHDREDGLSLRTSTTDFRERRK